MRYFTDNPLERMMMQRPKVRREERPPAPPPDHPCYGCLHYKGGCVGPCYCDLVISQRTKKAEF